MIVTIFWCYGTKPPKSLRDPCTSFLSGKQVTVCSESFNVDIRQVNLLQNLMLQRTGSQPEGGAGEVTDVDEGHNPQDCHCELLWL